MKKILFVASECVPFASSGGLGDVIGSLPAALKKEYGEKADIRVMIPLYSQIGETYREKMEFLCHFDVPLAWRRQYCGVLSLVKDGITYYFLDNEYYFKRRSLYGSFDDGERYAFFCRAALESLQRIDFMPDILHAHDWQSALAVVYLKYKYGLVPEYCGIKTVFTIHNIQYQGIYDKAILGDVFDIPNSDEAVLEYDGCINLMKGAIVCADRITTVSPTYAKEILSPQFSHGLHYVLEQNKGKIIGILNGIDTSYYNPASDTELYANYSARSLKGKRADKEELQKLMGLPADPDIPVLAVISRLVDHKGIDLITLAADDILQKEVQLIVLGTGDSYYEQFFACLAERYPRKAAVRFAFDKALAKKIYAGADIFLMPSRSEPCGLAQMIASRYGTVPLVRETGGLYDSIRDVGCPGGGNGYTFAPYSVWELYQAVGRALEGYSRKESWEVLVKTVMKWDFSWKKSARQYIKQVYGL
ncbi:MAG: glycogen synthase GlgA [Clostridia bacterium]|jgi:starch synthase|nr:glycogen synthase GlgA [Clostridia bacterium]MBO7666306.1 glycogen synthase GlgA [Clostridia bacterium]MBP5657912.1 glycogen synthase GlgA [Clostridia bacterium]